MTDKGGVFVPVVIEKRNEITRQVFHVVVGHLGGARRLAIPPLVGDDDVVARCGKGGHLVAPRKGMFWPAVTEHNRVSRIFATYFKDFEWPYAFTVTARNGAGSSLASSLANPRAVNLVA